MLATPAGLTMVTFLSLRMRPEALRPVKWRLAEWPRRIFPPAVTLKRLRAPRWVFNFIFGFDAFLGIAKTFLLPLELSKSRRAIPRGPVPTKADPEMPPYNTPFRKTRKTRTKQMARRNARVTAPVARRKQLVLRTWK